jgi:hypothetical protein
VPSVLCRPPSSCAPDISYFEYQDTTDGSYTHANAGQSSQYSPGSTIASEQCDDCHQDQWRRGWSSGGGVCAMPPLDIPRTDSGGCSSTLAASSAIPLMQVLLPMAAGEFELYLLLPGSQKLPAWLPMLPYAPHPASYPVTLWD